MWDENLIGKTMVVDGEEVIDSVAQKQFPGSKNGSRMFLGLCFKRYEPGHLERVAIFGDASQTGIGVAANLIKNDMVSGLQHIFIQKVH